MGKIMETARIYEVDTSLLMIPVRSKSKYTEVYGASHGVHILIGNLMRPQNRPSKTVAVFMHPSGVMFALPYPNALAKAGIHVCTCGSRYANNDSALIMENVLIDLGAVVRYLKEQEGYERVILCGWSGGGSLSLFYQSQAEKPDIKTTPNNEPPDLSQEGLVPADAMINIAAHASRARTLTEWIDPSVVDEQDPYQLDPELNIYDPQNPNQPPYSLEFIEKYRKAQIMRNRKITAWVRERLEFLKQRNMGDVEEAFVVHRTMADPRFLDITIDPNDREANTCLLGDPRTSNNGTAGLGRYSSLRSWLSQWSFDDSNADGPRHAARISVPYLIVENSADNACPVTHTRDLYQAVPHSDKELVTINGANHYYIGQKEKLGEAIGITLDWMLRKKLVEEF
jgi:alpha-beta hydrolase superfamily lysophospholipase